MTIYLELGDYCEIAAELLGTTPEQIARLPRIALEVEKRLDAIEYAQGSIAHLAPGRNLADELIADRRVNDHDNSPIVPSGWVQGQMTPYFAGKSNQGWGPV